MRSYVFRVWLAANPSMGYRPPARVWRDIELGGSHTLADFHEAIFDAFDRWDEQDYEFVTRNEHGMETRSYVPPAQYDGDLSWPAEDPVDIDRYLDLEVPTASAESKDRFRELRLDPPAEGNAAETTIADLAADTLGALYYEFDLDRGWEHHIELRETSDRAGEDTPRVLDESGRPPDQYPPMEE